MSPWVKLSHKPALYWSLVEKVGLSLDKTNLLLEQDCFSNSGSSVVP